MKIILSAIIIILASALASADVSVTIDTLSNQNNKVEFTVSNIEKHTHSKYHGVHVEKKEKGRWRIVRWHADCPCDAKCKRAIIDLGINESKKHTWDKKDFSCNVVTKGEYRFNIPGARSENTNKIDILGKSGEFTLP